MSIKKRLIFSNLGMIVIPILGMLLVEMMLGYLFFVVLKNGSSSQNINHLIGLRFVAMAGMLVITNGLLTYFVSKSIVDPIQKLSIAAKKISEGDLEYRVDIIKNDELGQLARTFEEMRKKLNQAQIAQKEYENSRRVLIASISHDLKTPLTAIKGYVKGIQDGVANTPEKLTRYMKTIEQSANDMDGLLDELFLYSKLDLEQLPFQFEKVDLYAFFADFIEEAALNFENEEGIAKLVANPEDSYVVEADREKLRRVVINIFQNSLKYMDKNRKQIQVCLISKPDQVIVEMRDNGSGMRKEDLPFIFDSFYRTDDSRNSATGGNGLGLSIAKKIIEHHGGSIWVESQLGKGTSVYFQLKR